MKVVVSLREKQRAGQPLYTFGPIMLLDGGDRVQNGWFVLRTLLAAGVTRNAVVWHVHPNVIAGWVRPPVVSYNQEGYTPDRGKVAVIELDPLYEALQSASVWKVTNEGSGAKKVYSASIKPWGKWLRYQYATFDFTPPDFPELREAWPFLWYENEYVVTAGTSFHLAAHAAEQVTGPRR